MSLCCHTKAQFRILAHLINILYDILGSLVTSGIKFLWGPVIHYNGVWLLQPVLICPEQGLKFWSLLLMKKNLVNVKNWGRQTISVALNLGTDMRKRASNKDHFRLWDQSFYVSPPQLVGWSVCLWKKCQKVYTRSKKTNDIVCFFCR